MTVVLAFDGWKECLTAPQACAAAATGLARMGQEVRVRVCPLSDGGEGFVATVAAATGAALRPVEVTGPQGERVRADLLVTDGGRTAVVEAAQACGLHLVPPARRAPGRLTTRGVGDLIRHAADAGARTVVVGIGGTATNDAGTGMLAALGWRLADARGDAVAPCGDALDRIAAIIPPDAPLGIEVVAACDVTHPLCGPSGAAAVFAPQKGASTADVARLDAGMRAFARLAAATLGRDRSQEPGAGAAGGLGFALTAFLGGVFHPGAAVAIERCGLRDLLAGADLCITGEGCTDFQTAGGKLPAAVAACCTEAGVPCACLSGALGRDWRGLYVLGFAGIFSTARGPCTLAEALRDAPEALADGTEAMARLFSVARRT